MTWLAWATFAVTAVLALVRVPDAVRGRNRSLCAFFALLAFAILLSLPGPYVATDALLGGQNFANLLLRFIIYGVALLLALRVAAAFAARRAARLLTGPWGLGFLAACSALLVVSFVLSGPGASAAGFMGHDVWPWTPLYGTLGRVYPSFTGIAVLPALWGAAGRPGRASLRVAAALLWAGYVLLAISNIITVLPAEALSLAQAINYGTILFVCAGLALVWLSSLAARRREKVSVGRNRVKNPHS
ncbi:hypothetical protein [Sinomonas sp. P47F7]|uniref:hypothetical protein n=1 Tax=Sinomonas sp. P47F7 TaxID=3410987 RepID=UPI003BF4CFE4